MCTTTMTEEKGKFDPVEYYPSCMKYNIMMHQKGGPRSAHPEKYSANHESKFRVKTWTEEHIKGTKELEHPELWTISYPANFESLKAK